MRGPCYLLTMFWRVCDVRGFCGFCRVLRNAERLGEGFSGTQKHREVRRHVCARTAWARVSELTGNTERVFDVDVSCAWREAARSTYQYDGMDRKQRKATKARARFLNTANDIPVEWMRETKLPKSREA
ncbi:unnamed protein product [Symbiodinium natans]|uniref:Uncharacterized protein n=1 Tax=Symbiodinium natans TaxID=878477 RepID=A0A812S9T2_9DINO|nr:unnamed protein product [Symbiodinium natans]